MVRGCIRFSIKIADREGRGGGGADMRWNCTVLRLARFTRNYLMQVLKVKSFKYT